MGFFGIGLMSELFMLVFTVAASGAVLTVVREWRRDRETWR